MEVILRLYRVRPLILILASFHNTCDIREMADAVFELAASKLA